jgi:preprotein translocase subunit YajC
MFVSEALAQTAGTAAAADPLGGGFGMIVPLVLMFAVMWFFMIRPQQKKQKEHQAMVRAAKRGDRIITSGGILGVISKANDADNDVEVEIAQGVKVRVLRSHIADIVNRNPEAAKPAKGGEKTVEKSGEKAEAAKGANDA